MEFKTADNVTKWNIAIEISDKLGTPHNAEVFRILMYLKAEISFSISEKDMHELKQRLRAFIENNTPTPYSLPE